MRGKDICADWRQRRRRVVSQAMSCSVAKSVGEGRRSSRDFHGRRRVEGLMAGVAGAKNENTFESVLIPILFVTGLEYVRSISLVECCV